MRLRFDANQEHQLVAVAAVADLFREQPHVGTTLEFAPDSGLAAVRNRLDLSAEVILRNLRVGGREFTDVPAAIDPGETASDLNIGTSILRDFVITTDFAAGAIWLEPRDNVE